MYSRQLGVLYCQGKEQEDICYIAYNMHWLKHSFALPALQKNKKWHKVLGTARDGRILPAGKQEEETAEAMSPEESGRQEEIAAPGGILEDKAEKAAAQEQKKGSDEEPRQIELDARSIVILTGRVD